MADLIVGRDENSIATFAISLPDSTINYATTLAASTEQTVTVPANTSVALFSFSPGSSVWVTESDTALALPGGAFAQYKGNLNPTARFVTAGETLRFISDDIAYVQVTFYRR